VDPAQFNSSSIKVQSHKKNWLKIKKTFSQHINNRRN
jgi:hypothetical protein